MIKRLLLIACLGLLSQGFTAQEQDSVAELLVPGEEYLLGLFPKQAPPALRQVDVSGFYRFFGTYTQMDTDYPLEETGAFTTAERSLFIADDTQLPNLWMNIAGRPNAKTSFSMDLFMFQFMDGNLGETYGSQVVDSLRPNVYSPITGTRLGGSLGLNLGINLYGSYATDIGSFSARMGGTHWYRLSDLTFSSFRGYNRFTLFERNPWDPVQRQVTDRYSTFYEQGAIQQDLRWGNRAFHGLIVEGAQLPEDFSFSLLFGKTELNGGFDSKPNSSVGGRVRKDFSSGFLSFNTFNSHTYVDSLARASIGFNVHTLEADQRMGDFRIHAEIGAGRYYSPNYASTWAEAINIKASVEKEKIGIPIELHYFRIAPEVINNNAIFWNTSIDEMVFNDIPLGQPGSNQVLVPFASSVTPIGLMTNNRTGLNINTEIEIDDLSVAIGYGVASEITPISNQISYSHAVNQLTRSRFWRWDFVSNVGPYGRYNVVYRDAYELIQLTDDEFGTVVNEKHFNTAEVQAKYSKRVLGKQLFAFLLGRYNTVQPEFNAIMPLNDEAYLRLYSTELEVYWELIPSLIWANYVGYERAIANYDTDINDETRRPRNQEGYGLGTGIDLSLGKNALFSVRHRFFEFEDKSFPLDQFRGQETLLEIKAFF
ncbi:MAG: hypothetical protein HKN79_08320 [Flavobacteriales bacterium]|nr:hypothetical protein [Flavobacteriales bacterium]